MMTFGYETKNKDVKTYANISNQRKNLPYSLSTKAAMRFNDFLCTHKEGFPSNTSHEISIKMKWNIFKKQNDHECLNEISAENELVCVTQKIYHKKTAYKTGDFIVDEIERPKKLMKIVKIFLINNLYYFIVELYIIEQFDYHFRSYKVGPKAGIYELVKVNSLVSLPFNLHKISNGNVYFRVKNI